MPESLLLDITLVVLLGVGAQWAARRLQLPSLMLLLVVGFVAGPVLGLLSPQALQADWFYAFVSLAAGLFLFEAGLKLRVSALLEVQTPVFRVLLLGGLLTWGLGATAVHFLLGFDVSLSVLLGLLLSIGGSGVTVPLLRHVRPNSRVAPLAKWEGIAAEPLGAILAVLVLNTLILLNRPISAAAETTSLAERVAIGLGLDIFIALGVSVTATGLLVVLFRRRVVPTFLRVPVTLGVVLAAFVVSNVLQAESGLLTTTLLGIFLVNQPYVPLHRSLFKGNVNVLLLGVLFLLLSAKLELSALNVIDGQVLAFLVLLVALVRPLAIFASSLGTTLKWEERAFLSWLSPPGGIAAVLAVLFAHRLLPMYPEEVSGMVPIVFTVIVGMGTLYALILAPLAQMLGVASPNPQGLLFVGADTWVRKLARRVQQLGIPVYLLDTNPRHVHEARKEGLPARQTSKLSDGVHNDLDLSSLARLLITVPHDAVASQTALHFSDVFETSNMYHLAAQTDGPSDDSLDTLRPVYGHPLFGGTTGYATFKRHVEGGGEIKILKVADDLPDNERKASYTYEELAGQYEEYTLIPLFIFRGPDALEVVSDTYKFSLRPEDRLIALVSTVTDAGKDKLPDSPEPSAAHEQPEALEVEAPTAESDDELGE